MENTVKIEQVNAGNSKLDAVIKVSKTVELAQNVTFMGLVGELMGVVANIEAMNSRKEEVIDLLASVAAAQDYSEAEIEAIKQMVQLDEATKTQLLDEIVELSEAKKKGGVIEVVGEVVTDTFIPEKKKTVEEEAVAPADPLPVTEE